MKAENSIWHRTGINGSDLYSSSGQHIGVIFSERNAQLCAAAPFMREILDELAVQLERGEQYGLLSLVKSALAACEIRKETP